MLLAYQPFSLSSGSDAHIQAHDIEYKIIKEVKNEKLRKSNIDIRLTKIIDKKDLGIIANSLRRDRKEYDRVWIFYYLPAINTDAGAWATTHFTPNLEVKILGITEKDEKKLDATPLPVGEIIGKWRDVRPGVENLMVIFKDAGKLKLKTTYHDGSSVEEEITKRIENGNIRYDYVVPSHGEYFILEKNKGLGMYGNNGKFLEVSPVK